MLIYVSRVADTQHPGLAKFGIALEWGSRGRWFESSNSDQGHRIILHGSVSFFICTIRTSSLLYFNCRWGEHAKHRFPTGSNPVTRTKRPKQSSRCFGLLLFADRFKAHLNPYNVRTQNQTRFCVLFIHQCMGQPWAMIPVASRRRART